MPGHSNSLENKKKWAAGEKDREKEREENNSLGFFVPACVRAADLPGLAKKFGLDWQDVDRALLCGLTLDECADALLTDRENLDRFIREAFKTEPDKLIAKYKARIRLSIIENVKCSKASAGPIFLAKSILGMSDTNGSNDDMTEYYREYINPKGQK